VLKVTTRRCRTAEFLVHLGGLRTRAATEGREVLVGCDWNIAHREADLRNWKADQKDAAFLPEERAWSSSGLDEHGYVDVVRRHHGPYSSWSYRGWAFNNDSGWRNQ
jgi:exodeoxyribonuclease-3